MPNREVAIVYQISFVHSSAKRQRNAFRRQDIHSPLKNRLFSVRLDLLHLLARTRCRVPEQNFPHFDTDPVATKHNGTKRDGDIIGENLDFFGIARLKTDHRAAAHTQQLMNRHHRATELDGNINIDVIERRLCHLSQDPLHGARLPPSLNK